MLVTVSLGFTMNPLKEFLEGSTIHGLVHISTAKPKVARVVWTVIVLFSFMAAGVLINNSFVSWSEYPISSTISTHPISGLKFPKVTICPPKGTNTALTYDLTFLNSAFTEEQKQILKKEAVYLFQTKDSMKYAKKMKEVTNIENIKNIYKGFQSIPRHRNLSDI